MSINVKVLIILVFVMISYEIFKYLCFFQVTNVFYCILKILVLWFFQCLSMLGVNNVCGEIECLVNPEKYLFFIKLKDCIKHIKGVYKRLQILIKG